MKKIILLLLFFSTFKLLAQDSQLYSYSEPPSGITQVQVNNTDGGLNLSVHTQWGGIFNYISHVYSVNGTEIDLIICYYFSPLPMEDSHTNNFFIPIAQAGNYTINITANSVQDEQTCENAVFWDSYTLNYLDTKNMPNELQLLKLFPNPADGFLQLSGIDATAIQSLEIITPDGKSMLRSSYGNSVEVGDLNAGIYGLKITTRNGSIKTLKFIKN